MTKALLRKDFNIIFQYNYLVNYQGKTLHAASNAKVSPEKSVFAFVPVLDDFIMITDGNTVALLTLKYLKR